MKTFKVYFLLFFILYSCDYIYPTRRIDGDNSLTKVYVTDSYFVAMELKSLCKKIDENSSVSIVENIDSIGYLGLNIYLYSQNKYLEYNIKTEIINKVNRNEIPDGVDLQSVLNIKPPLLQE